jgi:hypothetical protein
MIKTHKETGLKYLCKTSSQNPHTYHGSGKYWKRHLKEHGRNVSTEIVFETEDINKFNLKCLEYSKKYDVENSIDWANLIIETGLNGGKTHDDPYWLNGHKHSKETKKQISLSSRKSIKTRKENGTYKAPFLGKKHSEDTKTKMSKSSKGKSKSDQHKLNLSKVKTGVSLNVSEEGRESHSNGMKAMLKQIYKCSTCEKTGNAGHMTRYHKKCREKDKEWTKIKI